MSRYVEIRLEKRNVSCVARLLDYEAPLTAELVWTSLPLIGDAWHAKYAMNEVYCFVPPLNDGGLPLENSTIVPTTGDVAYFHFPIGHLARKSREERGFGGLPAVVDLAVFYGPNNYLFNPAVGFVPGNVFARVVENMDEMATAMNDVWRSGSVGERLSYTRHERAGA